MEQIPQNLRPTRSQLLLYQEWFEFAPDGYVITDPQGVILEANHAAAALLNVHQEFLIGKPLGLLMAEEHRSAFYTRLARLARGDRLDCWEAALGRPPVERRDVLVAATLLRNGDDWPLRVRWVFRDARQLQEARRRAVRAERLAAIGQMAAGLAHECRNALQRTQACLSVLMLRLKDQPEALELLGRIQNAQDDLRRLFEDVRTYALGPRVQPRHCDLRPIWREAWEDLSEARGEKRAELREEAEGVDLFCFADPFYLKNVFRNLLENALASGADPVNIVIRCRRSFLDGREAVQVSVRDNGPGFSEAARRRLFEPFFTTKVHGSGLGLAICKRILEAHGGRIEVRPEGHPGAEIIFTLPRRQM